MTSAATESSCRRRHLPPQLLAGARAQPLLLRLPLVERQVRHPLLQPLLVRVCFVSLAAWLHTFTWLACWIVHRHTRIVSGHGVVFFVTQPVLCTNVAALMRHSE